MTEKYMFRMKSFLFREVNEDNVLIRNVLVEFEDSLKYASYLDESEGSSSRIKFSSKFNTKVSRISSTIYQFFQA